MIDTPCDTLMSLVYISSAVQKFSPAELVALLEISRRNNSRCGITGMLLYKDGNFMQVIEGEASTIQRLHERIRRDPRHCGLITLIEKPIEERQFADWSMGFKDLSDPDLRTMPGFSDFMNASWSGQEFARKPSRAKKLLHAFKKNM